MCVTVSTGAVSVAARAGRWKKMRKILVTTVVGALLLAVVAITGVNGPASAAASAPTQGVTATTIRVGIPYVDLAAVRQFGITLDQGSFPDSGTTP